MDTLQIGRRHYQVPNRWNELRPDQLAGVLRELTAAGADPQLRRLRLLALLGGCPVRRLARLPLVTLVQLLPLTDFLTGLLPEQPPLTAQLLPLLRLPWRRDVRRRRWAGPASSLSNLSFGEFIFADTYFLHHARTGSPALLDKLLAVLYRPCRRGTGPHQADYAGDLREPFNEHRLGYHARQLRHLPAITKLSILAWYRGCRQQLVEEFADVFAPAGAQAGPTDWGRVLRQLAGPAFGPLEQTARQPVRPLLAQIEDNLRAHERAQAARPTA